MSVHVRIVGSLTSLVVAAALAGCGSSSSGAASEDKEKASSSSSVTTSPSAKPVECPAGAQCYDFAEKGSGWSETNEAGFFANQDPYLGGSFRIGGRAAGTWNVPAPVKVSELADDYGVRLDADVTPGQGFPADAAWGTSCWTKDLGGGRLAGFGVYVQPGTATLGLWDENDGTFKPLKSRNVSSIVKPGQPNHVTMTCRQDASSGSATAAIELQINGAPALSVDYANSVRNFGWKPDDGVGLFVAGKGSDAFFDNVVLAAATA